MPASNDNDRARREDEDKFDDEPSQSNAPEDALPPSYAGGPPQRQHKYSTKDMKPENPWKRWCWTILGCLVCIAIMIAISILFQKLFNPPEDEDWDDDKVNVTDDLVGAGELTGVAATLPKNMEIIEDLCSETRINRDDTAACEDACAPAKDCCSPHISGNSSCFETEPGGCFAYAKCHSLSGFFDPAHNDLDRICSKASLEEDPSECQNSCSALACCYTPKESCVAKHFAACLDYAVCQNLIPDSIDVAPMDLDSRCEKASPTCKRDCKEALACSDPTSKTYRDNFVSCLSYAACNGKSDTTIKVAPIYSRVKPAPPVLEDSCTVKGIAEFGVTKCLEACAPARCCWEDGSGGCFGDDPLGCMEYQRCTILKEPAYSGNTYPPTTTKPKTSAPAPSSAAGSGAPAGAAATAPTLAPKANATAPTGNGTPASPAPTAAKASSGRRVLG